MVEEETAPVDATAGDDPSKRVSVVATEPTDVQSTATKKRSRTIVPRKLASQFDLEPTPEEQGAFTKGGEKDLSNGPLVNRGCTDMLCVCLFILASISFIIVTLVGLEHGDPQKLFQPRDYRGDYCGVEKQWSDGRNLGGFNTLIYMMNTTHAVDKIAKQLVCSSAASASLNLIQRSGHMTATEMETYLCACCLMPCASCNSVLGLDDLLDPATLKTTMLSKMSELTDPSKAFNLFYPGGANGGMFTAIFKEATSYFVTSCVTACDVATYNGSDKRSFTYSPSPDVAWKRAWDLLAAHGDTNIQDALAQSFTFRALPEKLCPYPSQYCVPYPGVEFGEVIPGLCTFRFAADVVARMGQATKDYLNVADLQNKIENTFGDATGTLLKSLDALAITCCFAFVFSLLFLVILRFFVSVCIIGALISIFLMMSIGGAALFIRAGQCSGISFIDATKSYQFVATSALSTYGSDLSGEAMTGNGADYVGFQTRTREGHLCQRWDSQSPWNHSITPAKYPNANLTSNYCRNPINATYIWCFTTSGSTRWSLCNPIGLSPLNQQCPDGYAVSDPQFRDFLKVAGYVLWTCAFMWICCCLTLWARIKLAIKIKQIAAEFVYKTPAIILVPVCQGVVALGWAVLWFYCAAFLLSQVPADYVPSSYFATYAEAYGTVDTPGKCTGTWPTGQVWKYSGDLSASNDPCSGNKGDITGITPKCWRCLPPRYVLDTRFAVSLFYFLWSNALNIGLGQTIVAGACGTWFFTHINDRKMFSNRPIRVGAYNTLRYHVGSVAFGSLVIATVQFIRFVLFYFQKQAQAQKNRVASLVLKLLDCFMCCVEKVLKFLSKNAYIQVALLGKPFFTSARTAFFLITRNCLRFGVLTSLGYIVGAIGFYCIMSATVFFGYFVFVTLHPHETPTPVILYFFISFVAAKVFMTIFSMSGDAMIQCFIIAEEIGCSRDCVPPLLQKMVPNHGVDKDKE